MLVKELIEELQKFDPELPVGITYAENYEGDLDDYWVARFPITVKQTTADQDYVSGIAQGETCILIEAGY